ncbi:BspA family leucine-rich repeat surface protein [Mycoplasma capricolum]|uniref:PARCEL domain-containing protein n=2 Tax=Mycoplasma capricolum subsp. capricolum TaxID=40479 RepID=A0A0C2VFH8_MYCCA|nr:BspA family leucine-rich repeat surface protein [Mycoplasma capricolum]ABC01741.1 membrane protein, putative [Mycoplasma capricolum subsp. capricolum ATCC 27343]KIM13648.1 PARCEL domain-containing protein [Mycoplasma capricolum subsp. capricolum]
MKKIILLLSTNILIFTFLTFLSIKWPSSINYLQSVSRKINRKDEKSHVYNTDKTEITEIGYWTRNGAITIKGIPKTVKKVSSSLPPEITSLYGAFSYRNTDDVIVTGFERWDTKNITDMSYVFSNNSIVDIDLSFWDTSKVTNMNGMFKNAVKFNNGGKPLKWTTSNVETMESMFDGATNFDQNLKDWKVDKVKNNKNFSRGSIFSNYENKKPKWKGVIEINDPIIKKPETTVPEVIIHPSPPKPKVNIPLTRIITPATKWSPILKPAPDSKKGLEIPKANVATTNQQSKKLSTPAIVGIVVGSQVALTSLAVGAPYLIKRFKK